MAVSRAQETFAHVSLCKIAEEPLYSTLWRCPTRSWLNLSASLSIPSTSAVYRVRASCLTTRPCAQIRCKTLSITRASLTLPINLRWMDYLLGSSFSHEGSAKIRVDRALRTEIEQESSSWIAPETRDAMLDRWRSRMDAAQQLRSHAPVAFLGLKTCSRRSFHVSLMRSGRLCSVRASEWSTKRLSEPCDLKQFSPEVIPLASDSVFERSNSF